MGFLNYAGNEYRFDDRVLAHLKSAITYELKLHHSFLLNWQITPQGGSGRVSLWLSPNCPVIFRFEDSKPAKLSAVWVRTLTELANTPRGMTVISEQEAERYARDHSLES